MYKKIFVLIFIVVFVIACGKGGEEETKKFSEDYKVVAEKLKEKKDKITKRDEYAGFKAEKKTELENLLKRHAESPAVDDIEIIRSKILLELENLDEAEKKIDAVLANDPENIVDAKMTKVKILIEREKTNEAFTIFKEIEPQVTNLDDLFLGYYNFGLGHEDINVKEEYITKFLAAEKIPDSYKKSKNIMYFFLGEIAKEQGDFEKARKAYQDGIADTEEEREKNFLKLPMEQIDFIGKKAFPITVSQWINSEPLELNSLKDQVVVLSFWAPWCPSCRKLTPTLVDIYNENKDNGLIMIGYTRFYGKYKDDQEDKGKVDKEEELELIKGYVARKKMPYPIAISEEKTDMETYKIPGLPTLVMIDKKGNIAYTKIGGGSAQFLKDKVKSLVEAQ